MKFYISLIKKTYNRNSRLYAIKDEAILIYLFSLLSYIVTPVFLILKIKPNNITAINFILAISSLLLILSINDVYFVYGIFIYFIFRVLDFCDGNVARMTKQASFFGRFIDSILDIFYESCLILSIGFYCFKQHNSENLFFLGIAASIFSIYSTCIHDKYSSLVRWMNEENKTKFVPYLRKKYLPRVGFIMNDFNNGLLIVLIIFNQKNDFFLILSALFFSSFFFTSILNLSKHFYSAKKVLGLKAKDKKTYKQKN